MLTNLELVSPPGLGVDDAASDLSDLGAAPLAGALLHQHLGQQAALPGVRLVAAGLYAGQGEAPKHSHQRQGPHHPVTGCHPVLLTLFCHCH